MIAPKEVSSPKPTNASIGRLRRKRPRAAGSFFDRQVVKEALETTLACAKCPKGKNDIVPVPGGFQPLPQNILNLKEFFSNILPRRFEFCLGAAGQIVERCVIKELCDELDLWHCVNPFARPTVTPQNCYYRLHGHAPLAIHIRGRRANENRLVGAF